MKSFLLAVLMTLFGPCACSPHLCNTNIAVVLERTPPEDKQPEHPFKCTVCCVASTGECATIYWYGWAVGKGTTTHVVAPANTLADPEVPK